MTGLFLFIKEEALKMNKKELLKVLKELKERLEAVSSDVSNINRMYLWMIGI